MAEQDFDYGTEGVQDPLSSFKQPELGDHSARLRAIIHVGPFRATYLGKKKSPAPYVVAVFELKDDSDFEEDGTTPLCINHAFALRKGDRAFMPKFIKALDPKGKSKGFDDLIGGACTVNCKGSKKVNEDGTPMYVNFGGISGIPEKFAKMVEPLSEIGKKGHIRFTDLDEDAIKELNPIPEIANLLEKGDSFKGSKAEAVLAAIRKENPEFAKPKAGDEQDPPDEGESAPPPPSDLDAEKEY